MATGRPLVRIPCTGELGPSELQNGGNIPDPSIVPVWYLELDGDLVRQEHHIGTSLPNIGSLGVLFLDVMEGLRAKDMQPSGSG